MPLAPEGWENPVDAGVALDGEAVVDVVEGVDEVVMETCEVVQLPRALPSPTLPSKKEVDFHNLTHPLPQLVPVLCSGKAEKQCSQIFHWRKADGASLLCRLLLHP